MQPLLSESSKTEWREPFDFPTGISGFQLLMVSTPSVHLTLTLFSIILILLTPIEINEEYPINAVKISTQFGDQLKLWRLFQGINDGLRSGYMKHSTLQPNSRSVSSGYRMKHCVSHLTYYWLCNKHLNETNTSSQSTMTTDLHVYKQLFFMSLGYFWTLVPFL